MKKSNVNIKHERDLYAAGYSEGTEKNDCSVRAFAVAACVDYWEAHKLFAKHGRKDRRSTPRMVTHCAISEAFPGAYPGHLILRKMTTLKRFIETHPKGHFVIKVRGHCLAVTDGTIHDWAPRLRRIVRGFWKLV